MQATTATATAYAKRAAALAQRALGRGNLPRATNLLRAAQAAPQRFAALQATHAANRRKRKLGNAQKAARAARGNAIQYYYSSKAAHLANHAPQATPTASKGHGTGATPSGGWAAHVANLPPGTYTVTQALAVAGVVQPKGSKRVSCRAALLASTRTTATRTGGLRSPYVFTSS